MAFYGIVYNLDKTENFEEFVTSLKLPADKSQEYINSRSSQKIDKDGDEYVITTYYGGNGHEMKFKSGVEFSESFGPITAKNTIVVDGNKVVQDQKFDDGNIITYSREYSPEQLVVTITTNFWPGVAKRIYVAQ